MFTADGDLEDQDHLKYVILKIKIRSPKQRDLEDQDLIMKIKIMPISAYMQFQRDFYIVYPASKHHLTPLDIGHAFLFIYFF